MSAHSSEVPAADATRSLRWWVYWLLIVAAATSTSARIFSVTATGRDPKTPFLSANDRSRWAMIRALGDEGTFVVDNVIFDPETGKRVQGWHTIDLVRHRGWDGREHYYSSKPVLMPTLMAGVYWLTKQATGTSLATHPFYAGRLMLWLCNVPSLVLMGWLLARLVDRYGRSDWARMLAMTAATFGTLLTTFSITLNNHLHAAVCVAVTLYALSEILRGSAQRWHFFLAGAFASLTFANELPALAFLMVVAAAAWWCDWRKTLVLFVPAAAVVIITMAGLNYLAHGSLRPPYTHRNDGPLVATVEAEEDRIAGGELKELVEVLAAVGLPELQSPMIQPRMQVNEGQDVSHRYVLWDEPTQQRFALLARPGEGVIEVREWDNWYEYEGTYWTAQNKRGVDRGEPSKLMYAFHCLVGHHGLFSLTPLWLFSFAGMALALRNAPRDLRWIAGGTLLLSLVCLAFYLFLRPLEDRNYGGVTNGLRWMMWFIPLYLVVMLPALDRLAAHRWARAAAMAALAVGVFSAWYNPMNPWQHPWLFDYWEYLGITRYE